MPVADMSNAQVAVMAAATMASGQQYAMSGQDIVRAAEPIYKFLNEKDPDNG